MSSITTRCPKCHTSYQLTPDQLSIANGRVRCGNCQTIFQAVAQEAPAPTARPQVQAATKSASQRSSFVADDEDELLAKFDDDELIADGKDEFSAKKPEMQFSDEFHSAMEENGLSDSHTLPEDDEDWAKALLEDDEDDVDTPKTKNKVANKVDDDPFDVDFDDLGISLDLTEEEEQTIGSLTSKDDLRGRISAEPLEFALAKDRSIWFSLAYGFAGLLLAGGLFAQLLYFQFDELAKTAKWRPVYASICQQLGCQLPNQYNVKEIYASQLNVRSNKNYIDSLTVDTVIINQAAFAQPFPNIELFFTNSENEVVAARSFTPEEYLRGDAKNQVMMASNQPVHVALEINDPGKQALGYYMQLDYPSAQ